MSGQDIKYICKSAIAQANMSGSHPLIVIRMMTSCLCLPSVEADLINLKCHEWLYAHQQETTFHIRKPKTS